MKKLFFDVYIGEKMVSGQAAAVKAIVYPKFLIPHGNCDLSGKDFPKAADAFARLYDLGTYFADWFDIVEDAQMICADVYLNNRSLKKRFVGKDIITLIDKIDALPDYIKAKKFPNLSVEE